MWIRKRIDIRWRDLIWSAWQCLVASESPEQHRRQLELCWPEPDPVVALSVRTGFDALLASVDWQLGDEIIFSGLTIADMPRITRHHGFEVVAADIDSDSLAPNTSEIQRLITPRTRAIVIAHLFGVRVDLSSIADLADEHGILLIEDCAQAWVGESWSGNHRAAVSMFSFGPIKTNTALGGAVLQIRSPDLRKWVCRHLTRLPQQSDRSFLRRVVKYSGLLFLSGRHVYGLSYRCSSLCGIDFDRRVAELARSFRRADFFDGIRHQMSPAQTRLLIRRLTHFDASAIQRRTEAAITLRTLLKDQGRLLGPDQVDGDGVANSYWVFAITATDRDRLKESLVAAGFDATHRSSLRLVEDSPQASLPGVTAMEQRLLFIPVDWKMNNEDLATIADLIRRESVDRLQFATRTVSPT